MVGRGDDDEHGRQWVQQPEPAPPAAIGIDEGQCDEDRPAHVHARHGRVLVGESVAAARAVDGLPVHQGDVGEAGHHPGRSHREQDVHHQRDARRAEQGRARAPVRVGTVEEQPQQAQPGDAQVGEPVESVGGVREPVTVQQHSLQMLLSRQVQPAFDGQQITGMGKSARLVMSAEQATALVNGQQSNQQENFEQERSGPDRNQESWLRAVESLRLAANQHVTQVRPGFQARGGPATASTISARARGGSAARSKS